MTRIVRRTATRLGVVLAAAAGACQRPPPPPLAFVAHAIDRDGAQPCGSSVGCADIHLAWIDVNGGAPRVADRINARVAQLLRTNDDLPTSANTPELMAQTFQGEFAASRRAHPEGARQWTLMAAVSVMWRSNNGLLTLDAPTFKTQGGPHAISREHLSVIDTRDGRALARSDLFADESAVTQIVERFFRRAKAVPNAVSLEEYGWYFAHDRFALPSDVGLTAEGVVFHWDPSAIGPYIAGMTTLVVPYDSLRASLAHRVLP